MSFQEQLQTLRKATGLSQEKLAEIMGISRQAVAKWEVGQSYPDIARLIDLSDFFNVSIDKLVNDYEELLTEYTIAYNSGLEVMAQEYIPGEDKLCVNYNSYFFNNEPFIEFTAQKIRLAPIKFGVPSVVLSKYIPEIIEPFHLR